MGFTPSKTFLQDETDILALDEQKKKKHKLICGVLN